LGREALVSVPASFAPDAIERICSQTKEVRFELERIVLNQGGIDSLKMHAQDYESDSGGIAHETAGCRLRL